MLALTYLAKSVQPPGCGIDDRGIEFRFRSVVRDNFVFFSVHNGFSIHTVPYLTDRGGSFPLDKAAGA
jgi:hypothetical protein